MKLEQLKNFYPKLMGKQQGWCLQNCRLGYQIKTGHYASAKAAYTAGVKNKTVYPISELPNNVAVPVYQKTSSPNWHVYVYDKGTWYSDGKVVKKPTANIMGFDLNMDSVPVVKITTGKSFLPAKGYWGLGDNDSRIGYLASFMRRNFPAYTSAKALGNYYGKYLQSSIKTFQKRTGLYQDGNVGPKTYNKLKQYGFDY